MIDKYNHEEAHFIWRVGILFSGKSVAQVALRWCLQKDIVSSVIIGATTMEQLEDNMGAAVGWQLTEEEVNTLFNRSMRTPNIFAHELFPECF